MTAFDHPRPTAKLWRLCPGQRCVHRQWDDEFVVLNTLSGDCHLLDGAGFAVLRILQQTGAEGLDIPGLALALREQFDDIDETAAGEIQQVLDGLLGCELIETCP